MVNRGWCLDVRPLISRKRSFRVGFTSAGEITPQTMVMSQFEIGIGT
jgi:hypothetical protein